MNKPLGIAELGLQVGVLFDWQGRFGTAELGARIGFHLPLLPEVKAFAEDVVRDMPRLTYVRPSSALPSALDPPTRFRSLACCRWASSLQIGDSVD